MPEIGVFLSSEEHGPSELVAQAQLAERAGFRSVFISDHSIPGSTGRERVRWCECDRRDPRVDRSHGSTGVTCPTVRIHPAILAQAAATSQILLDRRLVFGVGSGEALNEHILGDRWPPVETRLKMLEDSVPESSPPLAVSAFGPLAAEVAARIGDGFITVAPDSELLGEYRRHGGRGREMPR